MEAERTVRPTERRGTHDCLGRVLIRLPMLFPACHAQMHRHNQHRPLRSGDFIICVNEPCFRKSVKESLKSAETIVSTFRMARTEWVAGNRIGSLIISCSLMFVPRHETRRESLVRKALAELQGDQFPALPGRLLELCSLSQANRHQAHCCRGVPNVTRDSTTAADGRKKTGNRKAVAA